MFIQDERSCLPDLSRSTFSGLKFTSLFRRKNAKNGPNVMFAVILDINILYIDIDISSPLCCLIYSNKF